MKKFLLASAAIGAMTAAERATGRYMRAPDGHGDDDGGFGDFEKAGAVEVGSGIPADGIETNQPDAEAPPKKPAKPATAAKPAAKPAEAAAAEKAKGAAKPGEAEAGDGEGEGEGDEGEGDEDEGEEIAPKPKPKASGRIQELNKRLRVEERLRRASDERLTALEKTLLQRGGGSGNSAADIGEAPNPADLAKYPLGHLDDRYIEDKLEWLAETKAATKADAVLQRQQESEQQAAAERQHAELLDKVDDLTTRGDEVSDDFKEAVLEAGMRGEWLLSQPTFEAAYDADNGAQILYDLSQDKAEAKRVAALTPYQQLKYVLEKDTEIAAKGKPRKIPGAGAPPSTQTRGANSRTRINPATDNLDDFEKAWLADEKGK